MLFNVMMFWAPFLVATDLAMKAMHESSPIVQIDRACEGYHRAKFPPRKLSSEVVTVTEEVAEVVDEAA